MSEQLPEQARSWFDAPEFVTLATVLPDGQPHLSVVWAARDGDDVLVSTLEGRRKHQNLLGDPRATVLLYPKDAPYDYVEVRGVVTIEPDPQGELIERLSQAYTGGPYTADGPDDVRVVLRLTPEKVVLRH